MAAPPTSVSSTRACGAPSQASTRRATRARRASSLGRRLPRRRDAATGFRIVDAVVVHPADDADELLLHLLQLLQRHRRLVELPLADFGPYDRSEEHTSELQSLAYLVCRLLLEKKK